MVSNFSERVYTLAEIEALFPPPGGSQYSVQVNNGAGGFYGDGEFIYNYSTGEIVSANNIFDAGDGTMTLNTNAANTSDTLFQVLGNTNGSTTPAFRVMEDNNGSVYTQNNQMDDGFGSGYFAGGLAVNSDELGSTPFTVKGMGIAFAVSSVNEVSTVNNILDDGSTGGSIFAGNIKNSVLTANTALIANGSNIIASSTTTSTELGYVSGVTSAIQTQINGKLTNPMTTLGDMIYGGASGAPTRLSGTTSTTLHFLTQTGTGSASAAPSLSTLNFSPLTNEFLTGISTSGVITAAQPAFSNLSGSATAAQLPISSVNRTGLTSAITLGGLPATSAIGTYLVTAYLTVTAVSVDVMKIQVQWTDETSTIRSAVICTMTTPTTGVYSGSVIIRLASGGTPPVSTVLTTSGGSITYDAGYAFVQLN